ncbi:MAG: 16S rRNA (guanine(966)-N(2))-methyltransferase RsmD [Clostridiales bacterium]|nr:16S rRNA (guanine(966)-N(2))-methyltransferase RsmD [Clostridiales bacterium]
MYAVRIIAGKWKGRPVASVKGNNTRPTSDMAKEALFNILSTRVCDCRFLDVFAGTGNVGLEALSRGATSATFIECDKVALHAIKYNIDYLKCNDCTRVIPSDAVTAAKRLPPKAFDIIFVDPPYAKYDIALQVIEALLDGKVLAEDGLLILQHDPADSPTLPQGLVEVDTRRYGKTRFVFAELEPDFYERKSTI